MAGAGDALSSGAREALSSSAPPPPHHSIGFYDPSASDLPEEGEVVALDASIRPDEFCENALHDTLDIGAFTLWPTLRRAIEALAQEVAQRGGSDDKEAQAEETDGVPLAWEAECEQGFKRLCDNFVRAVAYANAFSRARVEAQGKKAHARAAWK